MSKDLQLFQLFESSQTRPQTYDGEAFEMVLTLATIWMQQHEKPWVGSAHPSPFKPHIQIIVTILSPCFRDECTQQ